MKSATLSIQRIILDKKPKIRKEGKEKGEQLENEQMTIH